jgi:hypothetical protein
MQLSQGQSSCTLAWRGHKRQYPQAHEELGGQARWFHTCGKTELGIREIFVAELVSVAALRMLRQFGGASSLGRSCEAELGIREIFVAELVSVAALRMLRQFGGASSLGRSCEAALERQQSTQSCRSGCPNRCLVADIRQQSTQSCRSGCPNRCLVADIHASTAFCLQCPLPRWPFLKVVVS